MPAMGAARAACKNDRRERKRLWCICPPRSCCLHSAGPLLHRDSTQREHLEHCECYFIFSCASTFTWMTVSFRCTTSIHVLLSGAWREINTALYISVYSI